MTNTTRSLFSRRALLASAMAWGAVPVWANGPVQLEGEAFERTLSLDGAPLVLNGVGIRAVAWLKGYVAGLYLPRKAALPEQVLAQTGPKRIQLRLLQEVDSIEFVKALHKGIDRNTPVSELPVLAERRERFAQLVQSLGKLRKRDRVDLDYLPSRGLQMSMNGVERGQPIPGADLYAATLRIFIGERPVDKVLKAGLLGAGAS